MGRLSDRFSKMDIFVDRNSIRLLFFSAGQCGVLGWDFSGSNAYLYVISEFSTSAAHIKWLQSILKVISTILFDGIAFEFTTNYCTLIGSSNKLSDWIIPYEKVALMILRQI